MNTKNLIIAVVLTIAVSSLAFQAFASPLYYGWMSNGTMNRANRHGGYDGVCDMWYAQSANCPQCSEQGGLSGQHHHGHQDDDCLYGNQRCQQSEEHEESSGRQMMSHQRHHLFQAYSERDRNMTRDWCQTMIENR